MAQENRFNRRQLVGVLENASQELETKLSRDAIEDCITHIQELQKWNRINNLTAVKDPYEMVIKHVLDSISVLPFIKGDKALDMGTGAGFPGIPLALAEPGRSWVLLDASLKKVIFVRHVIASIGLTNVQVLHKRLQEFTSEIKFDTIICRALGSLNAVFSLGSPLLQENGQILIMKGRYPDKELSELEPVASIAVHELDPPLLNESRHLVIINQ